MDWQQVTSFVVVAATAVLLVRYKVRKQRRAKAWGCQDDCGCSSAADAPKLDSAGGGTHG